MLRPALVALLLLAACKNDTPHPNPPPASPAAAEPGSNAHGSGLPPSGAAPPGAPRTLDKLADGRVALGPFSMLVPADWTEKPSTSGMRAAQFQLPGAPGDAEVIVYYFGEAGAGSVQANIDRWLSQFKQPDGKPSSEVAKIEKAQYAGRDATLISVSGRYVAAAMPGGQAVDKPDQSLLAAIVESPKGPYYFRLIGSESAVTARAPQFREALSSLRTM